MQFSWKILEETVADIIGEDSLPVMRYLKGKENISEFKIAEDIKLDVNVIRNILYRMFEHNIVTYHRKKDRIKGWYISYWTLNIDRIKYLVYELKKKKLMKLKEKLTKEEAEEGMFFLCPNLCVRVDFDQATNFNFKCPECGAVFVQQDNTKTIENLKKKIKELEEEIKYIEDNKEKLFGYKPLKDITKEDKRENKKEIKKNKEIKKQSRKKTKKSSKKKSTTKTRSTKKSSKRSTKKTTKKTKK